MLDPLQKVRVTIRSNAEFARLVRVGAWALSEVMIASALVPLVLACLYLGLAQGFNFIRQTREDLRATQVLSEKLETIRLYTWTQITNGTVPVTFTNYYFPSALSNGNRGTVYTGTLTIGNTPLAESYKTDLRQVTAVTTWTSGSIQHQRQMTTFVARNGLQNYIYSVKQ